MFETRSVKDPTSRMTIVHVDTCNPTGNPLSSVVSAHETIAPRALPHYDRLRSVSVSADLEDLSQGTALEQTHAIVDEAHELVGVADEVYAQEVRPADLLERFDELFGRPADRRRGETLLARGRLRALANDVQGGRVWIEKVKLQTRAELDVEALRGRDDAIGPLLATIASLREDEVALSELLAPLEELRRRLPPELREGDEGVPLGEVSFMRDVLADVEPLLLERLLSDGESS